MRINIIGQLGERREGQAALLVVIAVLGVAVNLYQTRSGPAVGGDSVQYVMAAHNLLEGKGYSRLTGDGGIIPVTGFPPFYSTVLSVVGGFGADLYQASRLMNALFFGGALILVSLLMVRATHSLWLALLANLLIISSMTVLKFYGMVITEPLYILISLLVLYGLWRFLESASRSLLILLGALSGAAILTRYVGASLVGTGLLMILVFGKGSWRKRGLDAVLFAAIAFIPLALWFRRNSLVGDSLTNRVLRFHSVRSEVIRSYIAELLSWFVPRELGLPRALRNGLVALITLPAVIGFLVGEMRSRFWRRDSAGREDHIFPWLLISYIVCYLGVLILNSTFLDAGTTLGAIARYLLPVFIVSVMLFVIAVQRLLAELEPPGAIRKVALGYAVLLIGIGAIQAVPQVSHPDLIYLDYMRKRGDVVLELQSIDSNTTILTNNQEMVYLMAARGAYMWPILFDQYQQQNREDYDQQLQATREKLDEGAVLVVFGWPLGTEELVFDALGTERLASYIDVTFLGYPEAVSK